MKGWSTFYIVLSIPVFIFAAASLIFSGIGVALTFLLSALFLLTISSFCDRITEIADNQKKILKLLNPEPPSEQPVQPAPEREKFDMFER